MGELVNYILKKSNKRILMISTIIFIFFMAVVLPKVSVYTEEQSGTSSSPDTSLFYTSDDLYEMAGIYGESGRDTYILLRVSFDVIWPLVYLLFFVALTGVLINNLKLIEKFKYLILLPFISVIFDFLENISSVIVMYRYPSETVFFANLAPIMTLLKWITLGLSFVSIVILGVIYLIRIINERRIS